MTFHPLVERLSLAPGSSLVDLATLDGWLTQGGDRVLFFSGDPVRFGEALDVAVVLPELRKTFRERFDIGVVARGDEDAVAKRYGVQRWPSMVFVRDGGYVATIAGMLDWDDYLQAVARALDTPVSRAPSIGIPLVSAADAAGADAAHCH
jgi:hydrogenase-1 operon protein HyaE